MTTALIVGRAKSVWDEIAAAKALGPIDFVLVTGPIAVNYPDEIDAWVWFHTELFKDYAERRARNGFPPAKSYWGSRFNGRTRPNTGVPVKYSSWNGGGASGLIATMIALDEYKVDRVLLAGIPMTADGGQYDSSKPWTEANKHRHAWETALPRLKGRVRSFSGWTLQLLDGVAPTAEWMQEEYAAA